MESIIWNNSRIIIWNNSWMNNYILQIFFGLCKILKISWIQWGKSRYQQCFFSEYSLKLSEKTIISTKFDNLIGIENRNNTLFILSTFPFDPKDAKCKTKFEIILKFSIYGKISKFFAIFLVFSRKFERIFHKCREENVKRFRWLYKNYIMARLLLTAP